MRKIVCLLCFLVLLCGIVHCQKDSSISIITFPTQETSSCFLESKTLLGHGYIFINHLVESQTHGHYPSAPSRVIPTSTGLYVIAMLNARDIASSEAQGECIHIIRLNTNQQYEWHRVIDMQPTDHSRTNTSIDNAIVDEFENLYFSGVSNKLHVLDEESTATDDGKGYVTCLSKQGTLKWIQMLPECSETKLIQSSNTIVCVSNMRPKRLCVNILDVFTGEKISIAKYTIEPYVGDFWIDHEGVYVVTEQRNDRSWDLRAYSFTDGFQWKQTIPFPLDSQHFDGYESVFVKPNDLYCFQSNNNHLFFGGTLEWRQDNEETKQLFLFCLTRDGVIEWIEQTPLLPTVYLTHLQCDDDAVYLVGYTDTHFLPDHEHTFQSAIAGETDLFMEAFTMDHSYLWGTYLGGQRAEPAYLGVKPSTFYAPAFMQFQLHQDHLVLTTTTYSEKINEMNACPVLKRTNPNITSEPECSSLLFILSKQGEVKYSTYTATDAQDVDQVAADNKTYQEASYPRICIDDWVQNIASYGDTLYIISMNNDTKTLLTKSMQNKLSITKKTLRPWIYYVSEYSIQKKE
jgi:hypothetical protein